MKKVIIIGGGLGGLAAAITLANKGFKVVLYEKNNHLGGKLMPVKLGTYQFDFGPNTITMPTVFQEIISQTGEDPADYLEFIKLTDHTKNVFADGTILEFSSNIEKMKNHLSVMDPIGASNYDAFITEISRIYKLADTYFFPRTFKSWRDYLAPSLSYAIIKVRPLQTMDQFFKKYFTNQKVIDAFNRYATYIGSSPYKTPATFAMISYLELVDGVYFVKGGNVQIANAFIKLAEKLGVEIHKNTEVKKIHTLNKRVKSVELTNGDNKQADYVIMNADLLQAYPALVAKEDRPSFSDKKMDILEPSISAFVIMVGVNKRFSQLKHHNVFFSDEYKQEFNDLFEKKIYSNNPTIYISNSSFTDKNQSPDGDNLFILVNAPALPKDGILQIDPDLYKERIYELLATYGLSLKPYIVKERILTSAHIREKFGAYRGALYGLAANQKKDAFLRPQNVSKDIKNLFFVGGSTHPGGGSPLVTISGRNVANNIIKQSR